MNYRCMVMLCIGLSFASMGYACLSKETATNEPVKSRSVTPPRQVVTSGLSNQELARLYDPKTSDAVRQVLLRKSNVGKR